jgi:RimJ/RimL family protein N-acetyltransferase
MFSWQQVPEVRRFTPTPEPPIWPAHVDWLNRRLANPHHGPFSIIVHEGSAVGVLRLDTISGVHLGRQIEPGALRVSILVDPAHHSKGIAHAALSAARDLLPAATFYAEVLPGNEASHALFRAAGYAAVTSGLYMSRGPSVDP